MDAKTETKRLAVAVVAMEHAAKFGVADRQEIPAIIEYCWQHHDDPDIALIEACNAIEVFAEKCGTRQYHLQHLKSVGVTLLFMLIFFGVFGGICTLCGC